MFTTARSPFRAERNRGRRSQALGEDVTRRRHGWIEKNAGAPFFVFLHLFDLHTPENLPKAVRARYPGPRYNAELAYVDEVLGSFWKFLQPARPL